ncbi:MGMT family protein [Acidithiobacillus sp.]|uniref:methylated-DNA--[protein]-cysteine S-methyltransferase n=1 Tax=Acidithiobacillus sp. TaxID=1872118 RepID=UPI00338D3DE5
MFVPHCTGNPFRETVRRICRKISLSALRRRTDITPGYLSALWPISGQKRCYERTDDRRHTTSVLGDRAYRGPLLFPSHTPFQRQVLKKLQEIPRGEVRSYGWLAKRLEHPRASRAVGNALAWNPFPFVIPCHRVIRADGRLGKYSGGGDNMKARLLAYEGVSVGQGKDGTWRVQEGQGG